MKKSVETAQKFGKEDIAVGGDDDDGEDYDGSDSLDDDDGNFVMCCSPTQTLDTRQEVRANYKQPYMQCLAVQCIDFPCIAVQFHAVQWHCSGEEAARPPPHSLSNHLKPCHSLSNHLLGQKILSLWSCWR